MGRASIAYGFLGIILFTSTSHMARSQSFSEFIADLGSAQDSLTRFTIIRGYFSDRDFPVVEGRRVHFVYRGRGRTVGVPGEMNGWNPDSGRMEQIPGTDVFFKTYAFPEDARVEYKICVDSTWMLDSLNGRKALGGYGENSDVWLSEYVPPKEIEFDAETSHGRIDTIWFSSKVLSRTHPVFVYTPPGADSGMNLPAVYVTDGGEYLLFARMHNVLDNLIAEGRIRPVLGVFVDPRTDLRDPSTNMRMKDYAASDDFLKFLEQELAPQIEQRYPASNKPQNRLIMGASMGGLISTYAVLKRPEFAANCAAQSPAYLQADSAVIKALRKTKKVRGNIWIDTGTIADTHKECRVVRNLLEDRRAQFAYMELPEGHNWFNWRARLSLILEHFFAPK